MFICIFIYSVGFEPKPPTYDNDILFFFFFLLYEYTAPLKWCPTRNALSPAGIPVVEYWWGPWRHVCGFISGIR